MVGVDDIFHVVFESEVKVTSAPTPLFTVYPVSAETFEPVRSILISPVAHVGISVSSDLATLATMANPFEDEFLPSIFEFLIATLDPP